MVCNVIDECRCYAFRGEKTQFCGVRRGPNVLPCPSDCCFGGCTAAEPFRYIDRTPTETTDTRDAWIIMSILVLAYLFVVYSDLKRR